MRFLFVVLSMMFFVFFCLCIGESRAHSSKGVSISQPHWCPTNVQCDEYMREKVKRSLRKYLKDVEKSISPNIFSEQFALEKLGLKGERKNRDKEHDNEFIRVFKKEFRSKLPCFQLARREGKPLDFYFDKCQ